MQPGVFHGAQPNHELLLSKGFGGFAAELSLGVGLCRRGPESSPLGGGTGSVNSLFWPFQGLQKRYLWRDTMGRSVGGGGGRGEGGVRLCSHNFEQEARCGELVLGLGD